MEMLTVTTLNNSDFTVMIVTVGSASGSLKAEPKEKFEMSIFTHPKYFLTSQWYSNPVLLQGCSNLHTRGVGPFSDHHREAQIRFDGGKLHALDKIVLT